MLTFTLPAMREDRGRFARLREERVFVYWPHGLGDFAHLSAILPLLEPSNAYAIARFGDDYSALLDGDPYVRVLRSGERALGDGAALGAKKHLQLQLRALDGRPRTLAVPEPLASALAAFAPTALLWTDYPETEGRTPFPFHTKARNLARLLVLPERLKTFDLTAPLRSTVDAGVDPGVQREVDERLRGFAPPGSLLCVLSLSGFTAERKNWDVSQARAFAALLRRENPRARIVCMDDPSLGDASQWPGREIVAGYRELFADVDAPFARAFLALLARTDRVVAIPAGPLHVAMVRGGIRIAGLWLTHLPEWYDEPNADAVHLIGSIPRERGFDRRPATRTLPSGWHSTRVLDTRTIPAREVFDALFP
jgi:hypothetical protein